MFIIGHRGARAVEPENTLRAINEGMKCADYVEVDARLSKDRVPVIIHDATLDRTTNSTGAVGLYMVRELRKFDAGKREMIPTLEEVCLLVTGRCGLFCEIKEQGSEEEICNVLSRTGPKNLYIVSFHHQSLIAARSLLPSVRTGLIISSTVDNLPELAAHLGVHAVLMKWNLVNLDLVLACHDRNLEVITWTLDTPAEFGEAADLGIDGLASDNPCAARRFFRKE
jgi:glycerophosphoryl diester phosphodiesterase